MTDFKCKECRGTDVIYLEDISCWRRVLGTENRKTVVDGFYRTEGYDDGTNHRFLCRSCGHIWPADANKIEFT